MNIDTSKKWQDKCDFLYFRDVINVDVDTIKLWPHKSNFLFFRDVDKYITTYYSPPSSSIKEDFVF